MRMGPIGGMDNQKGTGGKRKGQRLAQQRGG